MPLIQRTMTDAEVVTWAERLPSMFPKKYYRPPTHDPKERRFVGPALRQLVYERDAGQCQYCGALVGFETCNIDHVVPYPAGKTVADNLVVACQDCNKAKGGAIIPVALRPR